LRGWPEKNAVESAGYRHPRASGGPGQLLRQIKSFLRACGGRFAACPWIPAFAGMTMRTQHIGKAQFISSQTLRSPRSGRLEGRKLIPRLAERAPAATAARRLPAET